MQSKNICLSNSYKLLYEMHQKLGQYLEKVLQVFCYYHVIITIQDQIINSSKKFSLHHMILLKSLMINI